MKNRPFSAVRTLGVLAALMGAAMAQEAAAAPAVAPIDKADTAWVLVSTALVLFMTPALAFFYGGFARSKNVLNTMMKSFSAAGFAMFTWVLIGYSLSFSGANNFIGDAGYALLNNVGLTTAGGPVTLAVPHLLWAIYQGTFCVITVAIVSGAVIERMRFPAYMLFMTLWSVLVYAPMAKMVWGGGFLADLGAWDFAGGTVVHINAGVAGLVAAIVVGKRKDYGRAAILPHNVPFILLGAALLWLGWFGFNAGSAWGATEAAALAMVNTVLAPAATIVAWSMLDLMRTGRVTAVGLATAIIIGLVIITPAAAYVSPISALVMGIIGAFPSYFALLWRAKSGLDDSLDTFAGHGVGGITGALLTGLFAQKAYSSYAVGGELAFNGALFGDPAQFGKQALAVVIAIAFSAVMTFIILKIVGLITPLRANAKEEGLGMDVTQHGEEGYTNGEGAVLVNTDYR